jgi:hypothetical protein
MMAGVRHRAATSALDVVAICRPLERNATATMARMANHA